MLDPLTQNQSGENFSGDNFSNGIKDLSQWETPSSELFNMPDQSPTGSINIIRAFSPTMPLIAGTFLISAIGPAKCILLLLYTDPKLQPNQPDR